MHTLKKIALVSALALSFGSAFAADAPKSDVQKDSYSMGASEGSHLFQMLKYQQEAGLGFDKEQVIAGFLDAFDEGNSKLKMSGEDVLKQLNARADKLNALMAKAKAKVAAQFAAQSKKFLEENSKKKGVTVTQSGLQYEVLAAGKGDKPRTEDVVTVDYVGSLPDGKVFESTYKAKQSARFVVMTVVPGFQEGLKLMSPGARYRLVIPAKLAYGAEGAGPIPPESAIVFEVELVKVEKAAGMPKGHGNGKMMSPHG